MFWIHLTIGVLIGLVVLTMSVTGIMMAYERQVLDWTARRHPTVVPAGAERLPLDTVLARAQAVVRDRPIVSLRLNADPAVPIAAGFENRQSVFVDPYTGAIVGADSVPRAFFAGVQRLHRSLAISSASQSPIGKAITGACNLAFLFLILSGFYLWWPRQWTPRAFRAVLTFSPGARERARDWNWHHVLGFWSAPALALIVISGAYMSYSWPGKLTQRVLLGPDERAPREEGRASKSKQTGSERRTQSVAVHLVDLVDLDSVWSRTVRAVPGWQSIQIRLPQDADRPVTVIAATGPGTRPDQRWQANFDAHTGINTGASVKWQTYAQGDAFRRFRSWIRPVHTGEAGGLAGQTIAAFASAAAVVLVWTGIALALRRLRASLDRRRTHARTPVGRLQLSQTSESTPATRPPPAA